MALMYTPLIAIILVNYNGAKDTIECIESLKKNDYWNCSIVVVDNFSTDDSVRILQVYKSDANFHLILATENKGFSAGNNIGIKYAIEEGFEYVLLLNNDTLVEPDFLSRMVGAFAEVDHNSVLTGTIYYAREPLKIWYAGGTFNFVTSRATHKHMGELMELISDNIEKTTFISGCEMLIPIEVVKTVGYLDEDYFLYSEDVDYSVRIQKKGFDLYYVPKSVIYHKVSSSTAKLSMATQYYSVRNRRILIHRNFSTIKKIFALSFTHLQTIHRIIKGRLSIKCVYAGIVDYYKGNLGKTNRNF